MAQALKQQKPVQKKSSFTLPGLRWWMFTFFILVMIINYMDRSSLSIAMPLISKELHINPVTIGIILSSFGWTYTIMQLPGGWLVDKLRPRKIVTTSLVGWGIAEALTGIASGVGSLIGMRMFLGVFEGPVQNGANSSLIRWLRKHEHARGSTLIDSGGPLGAALGGLIVTGLIVWLGSWRLAFAAVGAITVLIGIMAWLFMRDNPADHPLITEQEKEYLARIDIEEKDAIDNSKASTLKYFKYLSPWMLCIAFFGYDLVVYGLLTWAPTYLSQAQHLPLAMTGIWTFVIFGSGFVGEVFSGQLADFLLKKGASINAVFRTMLGFAGFACALAIVSVSHVSSAGSAIALISISNFFLRWGGLFWSIPARLASKEHVGRLSGAMNFSGNVAGIMIPILVGMIVQGTHSYAGGFLVFAFAGVLMAVGSIAINYSRKLQI